MITKQQAEEIATRFIEEACASVSGGVALAKGETISKPYGWIFFFDSNNYLRTGDWRQCLYGNSPFIVESSDGKITSLGTAGSFEDNVATFERKRGFSG